MKNDVKGSNKSMEIMKGPNKNDKKKTGHGRSAITFTAKSQDRAGKFKIHWEVLCSLDRTGQQTVELRGAKSKLIKQPDAPAHDHVYITNEHRSSRTCPVCHSPTNIKANQGDSII